MPDRSLIAIVAIGRNEGNRLVECLNSVIKLSDKIVYVDSGSTDDSVERAKAMGAQVVELSTETHFTAGRARNAGFEFIRQRFPSTEFVQFLDGDCVMHANWIDKAVAVLLGDSSISIVCGRRKEKFPDATIYNKLCDFEWNSPPGEVDSCGGDFLVRVDAFNEVQGFNGALIAGEEPEMCYRLRRAGWNIHRLSEPMTIHDAAINSFAQWAKRAARSGYAYAARWHLHWRERPMYCWRENARSVFWAALLPTLTLVSVLAYPPWGLALLMGYPMLLAKSTWQVRQTEPLKDALIISLFFVLSKFAEFYGQMIYLFRMATTRNQKIIEYK